MDAIDLQGAWAGYGGDPVLRGVSLRLGQGDLAGLMGPNGSGKSTLFRALAGLLALEKGSLRILGRDAADFGTAELARTMAFMPQSLETPFSFTAWQTVCMGRYPHAGRFSALTHADLSAAEEAMALVDVIHLKDRGVNSLSGGERQRVLLAQALAQEPSILLLDEPATHLDVQHQVELFELLGRINGKGITVFAILHDLNLASQYLGRIVLLKAGSILADGPPRDVVNPDLIEKAFGIRLEVLDDPSTGKPGVLYRRTAPAQTQGRGLRIHVICGGGSGRGVIGMLAGQGHAVSAGVLNRGDSDEVFARNAGAAVIQAPPFSPVPAQAHAENSEAARKAQAVVVCPAPIGPGNLLNLKAAAEALEAGVKVALVDPQSIADYTGGEARKMLDSLLARGAAAVASRSELAAWLRTCMTSR